MVLLVNKEKKCHIGRDISTEVRSAFSTAGRRLPPFTLVRLDVSGLGDEEVVAGRALTPLELATFHQFRFTRRRREWLAGRLAVKEAVCGLAPEICRSRAAVEVAVDRRGKPFLSRPAGAGHRLFVAISHSGDTALGLASRLPCALDIQELRSALKRVASRFVHQEEEALLGQCHADRLHALGMLWAAKEALRKHLPIWPLLGFLENRLTGVTGLAGGRLFSFQGVSAARRVPDCLPDVHVGWHDGKALAIIVADGRALEKCSTF